MNDEFLKKLYNSFKEKLHPSKDTWVYEDFLKDEKSGFDYFYQSLNTDDDFSYLKDDNYFIGKNINDIIDEVTDEIIDKISESYFFSELLQSSRYEDISKIQ